jgi:hypothetical protein
MHDGGKGIPEMHDYDFIAVKNKQTNKTTETTGTRIILYFK